MATPIFFISEQHLKDNSILNENVDMKLVTPLIQLVQDKYILQLLGTGEFNEVKSTIQSDPTLASHPVIKTLVDDYIQPTMIHWLLYELQTVLNYKMTNKNIAQKNSDNSNPANVSELKFLMDRHKDNAQYYSTRLVKYLYANPTLFPLYTNPGNTADTVIPKRKPYNKGMYMGIGFPPFIKTIEYVPNLPGCTDCP